MLVSFGSVNLSNQDFEVSELLLSEVELPCQSSHAPSHHTGDRISPH